MTNPVQQAILGRRSIRAFRPDAVTEDQLAALTAAALASPSAMDRQPWEFLFITKAAVLDQIAASALKTFEAQGNLALVERIQSRGGTILYGAPLLVIITLPKDSPAMNHADVGIAAQTLALAAQGLGLGSCIVAMAGAAFQGPDAEACRAAVGWEEGREFALSVVIGSPATTKDAHAVHPEKIRRVD